jgi:hypothetical protein
MPIVGSLAQSSETVVEMTYQASSFDSVPSPDNIFLPPLAYIMRMPPRPLFDEFLSNRKDAAELSAKLDGSFISRAIISASTPSRKSNIFAHEVIKIIKNFGDELFVPTNLKEGSNVFLKDTEALWSHGTDAITPFRFSVAVLDAIWENPEYGDTDQSSKHFYSLFRAAQVDEVAFAMARFPRVISHILRPAANNQFTFRGDLIELRKKTGVEAFAWESLLLLLDVRNTHASQKEWRRITGYEPLDWACAFGRNGVSFDEAIPFIANGILDVKLIARSVENGIDSDIMQSFATVGAR